MPVTDEKDVKTIFSLASQLFSCTSCCYTTSLSQSRFEKESEGKSNSNNKKYVQEINVKQLESNGLQRNITDGFTASIHKNQELVTRRDLRVTVCQGICAESIKLSTL